MYGFCPLASGSKGNSIFLGTKKTRILIDAGISFKKLSERLSQIDVDLDSIQAVLVTHGHIDHIQGVRMISEKLKIPILANRETAKEICSMLKVRPRFKIFTTGEPFIFEEIEVTPFSVSHDTMDPVAFRIDTGHLDLGFCTDLGFVSSLVQESLKLCDYLYLESNHEPSMVHACSRPKVYKQRVLSRQGHLSNDECAKLLQALLHPKLKHVHLAHLSGECNAAPLALKKAKEASGDTVEISIAHQEEISKCIHF